MIIGSATTIGGFFCLQFLSIPVLRDLGLFAGFSLIGAAFSTLFFLPHFIPNKTKNLENTLFEKFNVALNKLPSNKYVVLIFTILTFIFYHFAGNVKFENDMMKINYMTPQLKTAEKEFNKFSSLYQKSIFVISKGKTLEEALSNNEKILPALDSMKKNGDIYAFTNVSSILVSDKEQKIRIERWNNFWSNEKKSKTIIALCERLIFTGFGCQFLNHGQPRRLPCHLFGLFTAFDHPLHHGRGHGCHQCGVYCHSICIKPALRLP